MMADELLNAQDLITAKKHDTFHSEVVTGKTGGLSTGANIDYATNAVTGQVQKTLPKVIDDIDWSYVGLFADGVTFTDKTDFAVDAVGTQWIYTGSLPFSATAGTVPNEPTYQVVHVKSASAISNANGGSVQDFIDFNDPKWAIVTAYGADDTGSSFSTDAFMAAQAASDFIVVPYGTYTFDPAKKWRIFSGKTWFFMGPTFTKPPATAFAIAYAEFEADFNLLGSAKFVGNATATDIQNNENNINEIGLYIESCARYKVGDLSFRNFAGFGLKMSGATGASPYFGERGRFGFISASVCHYGMSLDEGNGSEYNTFLGYDLSANRIGLSMGAGNNTFAGGVITGNRYANVELIGGGNDGHGTMSATTINHAGVYNLLSKNVQLGFNFVGCHFFGNAPDSNSGQIFIQNSKGINFNGGTLDCWVNVWGGADSGLHRVSNMYCPGSYGKVKIYDELDLPPTNMLVSGCFGDGSRDAVTGANINSPDCFVSLGRGPNGGQALSLGAYTVLQFGNSHVLSDTRRAWNNLNYVFTVPQGLGGIYKVSFRSAFQTTGTIDIKTSRLRILKNGVPSGTYRAYSKALASDDTDIVSIDLNSQILLNEGDTIQFEAQINGTGTPVWADPDGRMVCEIVRV